MPNLGGWEILVIILIVVLLFGAKKLPDAARSLGRSMRIFKSEVHEMKNDDERNAATAQQQQLPPASQPPRPDVQPQSQPHHDSQQQP